MVAVLERPLSSTANMTSTEAWDGMLFSAGGITLYQAKFGPRRSARLSASIDAKRFRAALGRWLQVKQAQNPENSWLPGSYSATITLASLDCPEETASKPLWITSLGDPGSSTAEVELPAASGTPQHLSWNEAFARLEEFARLPLYWDSYDADPIAPAALARAREVLYTLRAAFDERMGESFMPQNIVPIADGGIQFEWYRGDLYLEVEIEPTGMLSYLVSRTSPQGRASASKADVQVSKIIEVVGLSLAWHISL